MPISYTIDVPRRLVRTTVSGRLTDEDLIAHKEALLADPEFEIGMKEISDVRGVEEFEVTPYGIMAAAHFDSAHTGELKEHRLSIIAPSNLIYGMARMYGSRTDGNTGGVGIFRSEEEALAWLEESD